MANDVNKKKLERRKQTRDQVNVLFRKGSKKLLHALSVKEHCTVAEVVRRAVLSFAGLERLPGKDHLEKLEQVDTDTAAADALIDCHAVEYVINDLRRRRQRVPEGATDVIMLSNGMTRESLEAIDRIRHALQRQNAKSQRPQPIEISRRDYLAIQRILASATVEPGTQDFVTKIE